MREPAKLGLSWRYPISCVLENKCWLSLELMCST